MKETSDTNKPSPTDGRPLRSLGRINLTDDAHREIARGLSIGRFLPGAKLVIRDLAEELNISPTPVREALQQLVAEGVLVQEAGRSFRVPELGPDDYHDLRNLRVLIEGEAAAMAATRIQPEAIDQLDAIHAELVAAVAQSDFKAALVCNQQFHLRVCIESGSPRLYRIVDGLWLQMGPLLNMLYTQVRVHNASMDRHWHLLLTDAFRQRDAEKARFALQSDIAGRSDRILAALNARLSDTRRRTP